MNLGKITKYVIQKEYIAGLSINDSGVQFILFSGNNDKNVLAKFEIELAEGVVEEGIIKKAEELKKILKELRSTSKLSKISNLNIILSLSSDLVYHKTFDLPVISTEDISDAIELNLKMISPIKFEEAYSDWEIFRSLGEGDSKYRISSVFGKKEIIDSYLNILEETDFIPLAVEFNGLSIWRLFHYKNIIPQEKSCLIIFVYSEGIDFNIVNRQGIQFSYFESWKEAIKSSIGLSKESKTGELKREDFFRVFEEESRKVFSFFSSRFQNKLDCFYLFSPMYQPALEELVSKQFSIPSSKKPLNFNYSPNFFSCAGAGVRGFIPRIDDIGMSLMRVGTEEKYRRKRYLNFISFWNKITISILILLIATFFGVSLFFNVLNENLKENVSNLDLNIDMERYNSLRDEVEKVNQDISQVLQVKNITNDWTNFFKFIEENLQGVVIQKLTVSGDNLNVSFRGRATSEQVMLNFKNELANNENLLNVDIPLQSIVKGEQGIEFNLNFKIEKLF
jgi:hypothetical protein